ncbi:TPA: hypothetical protein RZK50_001970 [Campylobacter coli]|nr:hypothetical protein [Campylobacter coli]
MNDLKQSGLDDMPSDSYHSFLKAYKESIDTLIEAFKTDTTNTIKGLYDFIYNYEENEDTIWQDRTLMQVLLLIELNQKEQALKILKNNQKAIEERDFTIEYDDGSIEVFDVLKHSIENDLC